MGFFDFFKQVNINQGVEEYKATADAVLVDELHFHPDRKL